MLKSVPHAQNGGTKRRAICRTDPRSILKPKAARVFCCTSIERAGCTAGQRHWGQSCFANSMIGLSSACAVESRYDSCSSSGAHSSSLSYELRHDNTCNKSSRICARRSPHFMRMARRNANGIGKFRGMAAQGKADRSKEDLLAAVASVPN